MNNILLLNDFSAEAEHAFTYAQKLAQTLQANLLIWNLIEPVSRQSAPALVAAGRETANSTDAYITQTLLNQAYPDGVGLGTITHFTKKDTEGFTLHELVQKHQVNLIIKGTGSHGHALDKLTSQFLRKTLCPVLLVPQQAEYIGIKQMVYLTDLRYCRAHITGYLKQIAHQLNAGLAMAHITAAKLPEPETTYALTLYRQAIGSNSNQLNLSFQHITEPCINKAADVLINALHNNWLAMAYGKHHHNALSTACATGQQKPAEINVPLLLFNC
ncbi:universal stress protein [Mucilaginibacter sp. CSA2-8R]|uniref:universal stress protein n=1 Tax=Mucilaginibacter sp. CSA2-8R TaxID=3141542 RepID=UPI00315C9BC5